MLSVPFPGLQFGHEPSRALKATAAPSRTGREPGILDFRRNVTDSVAHSVRSRLVDLVRPPFLCAGLPLGGCALTSRVVVSLWRVSESLPEAYTPEISVVLDSNLDVLSRVRLGGNGEEACSTFSKIP